MLHPAALLTAEESRAADKLAVVSGIPSEALMENAGKAVVDICLKYNPCPVLVVCGTGNNGGDGFVTARLLKDHGWPVGVAVVGEAGNIAGDAAIALEKWRYGGGNVWAFTSEMLKDYSLIVDAIFGTGLTHDIEGPAREAVTAINKSRLPVIAVDIPSGVNADTGAIRGAAVRAEHTVTFVRPKPGHVLLPGKAHTGGLHVYDIGIRGHGITPRYFLDMPALWKSAFPLPAPESNKYSRGHALVIGGGMSTTGAARLAAMAALRSGSGLVTIGCPQDALPIYAMTMTAVMTRQVDKLSELTALLDDKRITGVLIGPGCGLNETTRERALHLLSHKKPCVFDADALSIFHANPKSLFSAIAGPVVLTPHEGEFSRLFTLSGTKTERAAGAAKASGAVIVLKGNDTVIAAPDGRIAINASGPVWLATAGAGDVLGGIITGLLAQGMPTFEAACAGVWIHGEAAAQFGPGLIAEDLPGHIPPVLKTLYA